MNGSTKLMAALRISDQAVGGLYRMTGEFDDDGDDTSLPGEYCSLSDRMVTPESARCALRSSVDIVMASPDGMTGCRWWELMLDKALASYDAPPFTWNKADPEQMLGIRRKLT